MAQVVTHLLHRQAMVEEMLGRCVSLMSARDYRHFLAMNLLRGGTPLAGIGNLLRHGSAETTQVYLHADLRIKGKAMEKTRPVGVEPGRFKPDNTLLCLLKSP